MVSIYGKYVKCKGWLPSATKMQAQLNDFPFHLLRRFCVCTCVAVVHQCICLFAYLLACVFAFAFAITLHV